MEAKVIILIWYVQSSVYKYVSKVNVDLSAKVAHWTYLNIETTGATGLFVIVLFPDHTHYFYIDFYRKNLNFIWRLLMIGEPNLYKLLWSHN